MPRSMDCVYPTSYLGRYITKIAPWERKQVNSIFFSHSWSKAQADHIGASHRNSSCHDVRPYAPVSSGCFKTFYIPPLGTTQSLMVSNCTFSHWYSDWGVTVFNGTRCWGVWVRAHHWYRPEANLYRKQHLFFSILLRQGGCPNEEAEVHSFLRKQSPTGSFTMSTTSDVDPRSAGVKLRKVRFKCGITKENAAKDNLIDEIGEDRAAVSVCDFPPYKKVRITWSSSTKVLKCRQFQFKW